MAAALPPDLSCFNTSTHLPSRLLPREVSLALTRRKGMILQEEGLASSLQSSVRQSVHFREKRSLSTSEGPLPFASLDFLNRRAALAGLILNYVISLGERMAKAEVADEKAERPLNLESYVNEMEGFVVLKPVQWSKVDKAGATVLFEDPESKGNNLGVVINPVRISSLSEFGTPDAVASKLLQAEMKKPSTNNVQLINVQERQVRGVEPLYQLEYKLDSTRGAKRIFSAVTVSSKKLYILNLAFVDSPEKPLSPTVSSTLHQIMNSFDLLN